MEINPPKRISTFHELMVLLRQGLRALTRNRVNLLISLFFPFLAVGVTIWIAGKDMFQNMESTQSACFILVCAAIWGGLFNSIQTVVRERKNVRRDYLSGALRISCYTLSRAIIQMLLCAFQSAVMCLSFYGVHWAYKAELPSQGLIFGPAILEYYITLFLVMLAADALGLCISCIVKNEQIASQLSPYILIVQLLFSGVLFAMEGAASGVSALMLSRWGMEALGSISNLNGLPLRLQEEFPMIPHQADDAFLFAGEHLRTVWLILLVFVIVPVIIGNFALHGVKKDKRG